MNSELHSESLGVGFKNMSQLDVGTLSWNENREMLVRLKPGSFEINENNPFECPMIF